MYLILQGMLFIYLTQKKNLYNTLFLNGGEKPECKVRLILSVVFLM